MEKAPEITHPQPKVLISLFTRDSGRLCLTPQFSYLKYTIDLLAPDPLGVREAHGLAVHQCLLPLVLVFAPLVASDVGNSCKREGKAPCLQAAH